MMTYQKKRGGYEAIPNESLYQRAAAEWVARYNRSPASGVTVVTDLSDGRLNPICVADNLTSVTFANVGAYWYSEDTFDVGAAGLAYTYWEPYEIPRGAHKGDRRFRPIEMEIRWDEGMDAGQFIEECVAILDETAKKPCGAIIFHGPGHMSRSECEEVGPHEIHRNTNTGRLLQWLAAEAATDYFNQSTEEYHVAGAAMSLYNIFFGKHSQAEIILATLGLSPSDMGRFRDCFISDGQIVVYTRNGGGNRECWHEDDPKDGSPKCRHHEIQEEVDEVEEVPVGESKLLTTWHKTGRRVTETFYVCEQPSSEACHCVGCFMEYHVAGLPYYLYDQDDDFDCTYASIYFSFPPEYADALAAIDQGVKWDPDKFWLDLLASLENKKQDEK